MSEKIGVTAEVGGDGLHIIIPFEDLFRLLKPKVEFTAKYSSLTKREQEVLDRVLQGQGNKEIASALNVSERNIKFHVTNLLQKANVTSRHNLRLFAGVNGATR